MKRVSKIVDWMQNRGSMIYLDGSSETAKPGKGREIQRGAERAENILHYEMNFSGL